MIHSQDVPLLRWRCSHCSRGQTAGASWHSDGLGHIYCERCVAKAIELLKNMGVSKRITYREYRQATLDSPDVAAE